MNKGDVFIVSSEEYQQWYFGQMWAKNSIIVDDEDDDWQNLKLNLNKEKNA